jgi:branched-chain amino acid transport system permease protein
MVGIVLLVVVLAVTLMSTDVYVAGIITSGCGYFLAALGYNVSMGYAGQFVFGQAGYVAIGAYAYALALSHGVPQVGGLVIAGAAACIAGGIVGAATVRTRGIYLALVTLAFAQAITTLAGLLTWTNGNNGLPAPFLGGDWLLPVVLVFIGLVANQRLIRSRTGRALLMMRADESAASAMGVGVGWTSVVASSVGAAYGGVGGAVIAGAFGYITPDNFTVTLTLLLLTMIVVGGLGSMWGVALGTAVMTALPNVLGATLSFQQLLYGVVLFGVLVLLPRGLVSLPERLAGALGLARDRGVRWRRVGTVREEEGYTG